MIKKERLEELIEQGATIYGIDDRWDIVEVRKLDAQQIYYSSSNVNYQYVFDDHSVVEFFDDKLFETKEDAEEYAEFGEVKKEIKFPFVDWQTLKHDFIDNPKSSGTYVVFEFDNYSLDIVVCHTGDIDISVYEKDFYKPLTRENYNEARRLCVKLFKGESV